MARKRSVKVVRRSLGRFVFDKAMADAAVEFFPRFLRFVDGEWAGKPFRLSPHQEHDVRQIFGWRRRSDGTRRYRFVRKWIPRKNGKTEEAAGMAHLLTVADEEPGAQVYAHALDGKQSAIVYDKAARMVGMSRALNQIYTVTKTGMLAADLMASFKPLSGEAYGKHGLSPHGIIGDEAHAWKNGKLHTFLIQGSGARRQPLDYVISTAGEIKTYGHELYEQSKAILNNPELSPETYVVIHEADPADDWTDPKVWAKANPNLDVSLKRDYLEAECRRAMTSPRLENDFRRYHLNQWVEQKTRWLPMKRWPANTAEPNNRNLWKELPRRLAGRPCFAGIDLGSVNDLTAKVLVFPPAGAVPTPQDRVVLLPCFLMPEDNVAERDDPRHPYPHWVREGAIKTTPGNVTDYDFLVKECVDDAAAFRVQCFGIDVLFQAMQVAIRLGQLGLPVEMMRQGHLTLGAPSAELERLFLAGLLEHGNHPVLEWMFGNAVARPDDNGNIKPDKKHAAEKIDGVVATVEGIALMQKGVAVPVDLSGWLKKPANMV